MHAFTFREALGIPRAIGAYPPEVRRPTFFKGGVDDPLAVGRPDRVLVKLAGKSQAREGIAFPLVHPDVSPFAVKDFQSQTLPVGRKGQIVVAAGSLTEGGEFTIAVHPVNGDVLNPAAASDIHE